MERPLYFKFIRFSFIFLFGLVICLSSCEPLNQFPEPQTTSEKGEVRAPNGQSVQTFYGPAVSLGQGVARGIKNS